MIRVDFVYMTWVDFVYMTWVDFVYMTWVDFVANYILNKLAVKEC